jgi:hypothetical protein
MRALLVPAAIAFVALAVGAGVATAELMGDDAVKSSSITGEDVKDGSLTRADFGGSVRGPAGPRGRPGIVAARLERVSTFANSGGGSPSEGHAVARCPAGKRVIGGGGMTEGSIGTVTESYPKGDLSGWVVNAIRAKSNERWRVTAIAICVAR